MEQLNFSATKDNERVYKILGDLLNADKEFQIMITVPAGHDKIKGLQEEYGTEVPFPVKRDLVKRFSTFLVYSAALPTPFTSTYSNTPFASGYFSLSAFAKS